MNATPAALTARTARRRGLPGRALLLFFKRKPRLKNGRNEERQNARKTTCHLGGTSSRCGRNTGPDARSLHRISQLQPGECPARARTVRSTQLAARTAQHLSRLARKETASP